MKKIIDTNKPKIKLINNYSLKSISNFTNLKAFKYGELWYIIDCASNCGNPFNNAIGGFHHTYRDLMLYAETHYFNVYN